MTTTERELQDRQLGYRITESDFQALHRLAEQDAAAGLDYGNKSVTQTLIRLIRAETARRDEPRDNHGIIPPSLRTRCSCGHMANDHTIATTGMSTGWGGCTIEPCTCTTYDRAETPRRESKP